MVEAKNAMTTREKLRSRMTILEDGCWQYTGGINTNGYGYIWLDSKQQRVHIVSYREFVGPILEGQLVLHKCDNRSCINPDHLFLGTPQDNVDDMRIKNRDSYGANFGENNGQAILVEEAVIEIKQLLAEGRYNQAQIGKMFGVTRGAIKQIKYGRTWKHLKETIND